MSELPTLRITEKTLMPISLVIVLIVLAASVTSVRSETITNSKEVMRLRNRMKVLTSIDERLSHLEGALHLPVKPLIVNEDEPEDQE